MKMDFLNKQTVKQDLELTLFRKSKENSYMLTPFMVTFCQGTLTDIDIEEFLKAGLRIVRFKMSHIIKKDKMILLAMLKSALKSCCEKCEMSTFPVAVMVDLPNTCIRTGYLTDDLSLLEIYIQEESIVKMTSDTKYWNKCDSSLIFIDDPYTIKTIKPNNEISIDFGAIQLICTEVINDKNIKCKVISGGNLGNGQFVCIRDIKYKRPPLTKHDKELIYFAKEYQVDAIMINSIRTATTISKVRSMFSDTPMPLIVCSICEQEGLSDIDSIIEDCDGIVFAREFLSENISNISRMASIQLNVAAKCKQAGKPFYVSGQIFNKTMFSGKLCLTELSDVTNAVIQGAGLVLKNYDDADNVLTTMNMINALCKTVEPLTLRDNYSRIGMELKSPVNAADGAVLAAAIAARLTGSEVIIALTVTGATAIQLSRMALDAVILAVSTDATVARRLQLYRGIVPIIYEHHKEKHKIEWYSDMKMRVLHAITYGQKYDLLKYNHAYVVLRKATPNSPYCDQVSIWKVSTEPVKKHGFACAELKDDRYLK